MTSEKGGRKDKNQNIQVFVRLRPLNQRERDIKSLGVIEVLHNREVVVRQSQQASHTKKFTFDRAFGPNVKQVEVYQEVVSPLIEEVLAGYNCTVFAYGQTGTGKTHTMVGENTTSEDINWQNDPLAGIIPRALSQLFDELRISNTEHTVRVSYLELYNEELFDLLSTSEDNSKLRIYEDVTRKGSNIVNGLEEITVSNKNEVYKIMAQGQERKRVASTLMNAQSSRSHTVFTIVVHMKENSPEGEELVKIGKLNLVDLAGSENISKAGSDNPAKKERARECVNINQSLLTLGRVITALVEKHPHIPYRESKLTRILQESLGGRTKTSIIATISPGHKDVEETMSTLDYANRAKNIQNKPEVNQKMTKRAILRQYAEEIDRLKKDLQAARDKNGVFLSSETYTELTLRQEEQRKEIQELLLKKRAMEEEKDKAESIFSELHKTLEMRVLELNAAKKKLADTKTQLANTHNILRSTQLESEERAHLVEQHLATESALGQQARELLAAADAASSHAAALLEAVDRRRSVESCNLQVTRRYREQAEELRARLTAAAQAHVGTLRDDLADLHSTLESFTSSAGDTLLRDKEALVQLAGNITQVEDEIKSLINSSQQALVSATASHRSSLEAAAARRRAELQAACAALAQASANCVQAAKEHELPESVARFADIWHKNMTESIEALQQSHGEFKSGLSESEAARSRAARAQRAERGARLDRGLARLNQNIAKLEEEKSEMLARFEQRQAEIESERLDHKARLMLWVEEERRVFEERMRVQCQRETAALELRLSKEDQDIKESKARLSACFARQEDEYRAILAECERERAEAAGAEAEARAGAQRSGGVVGAYNKEFDDGVAALASKTESLVLSVTEEARRAHEDLVRTLLLADTLMQTETQAAAARDSEATEQFLAHAEEARISFIQGSQEAFTSVLAHIEASNSSSVSRLSALAASAEALESRARQQGARHAAGAQLAAARGAGFLQLLQGAVARQAELERSQLGDEYKVYSPTGATPRRAEYRYPRALAATSPAARVLARYRARRRDDCIVVESDTESRPTSDAESTLSEDSAVFAAPSPPELLSTLKPSRENHNGSGIVKCTSESDIYNIRRNQEHQGKENADHSLTNGGYKKVSKLRAPSSHKKPLVERNGSD